MDKYQIVEVTEEFHHAGTKATADIAAIAGKCGFQKLEVRMCTTRESMLAKLKRQMGYYVDWNHAAQSISEEAVVLLQHPFHYKQLTREKILKKLKTEKHVKYISLVHDVEKLRAFRYNEYYRHEFDVMLELADVIVVHNEKMKRYFAERGVPDGRLVNLGIFDYLQEEKESSAPHFSKSIIVAGNLDTIKCAYIEQLGRLETIDVHLYGSNFNETMKKYRNIHYHGSFPVDEIPEQLTGGFGLVWDGHSIEGCLGQSGQYLKYNNPHKLSLYLSSGLPVVIWNGAAEAGYVSKHGVGFCVENLWELDEMFEQLTEKDYRKMAEEAADVRDKLIHGEYARLALEESVKRIKKS